MAIWRAEVFYQISGDALPAASGYANLLAAPLLGVTFVARDDSSGALPWWAIVISQKWVSTPAYVTHIEYRFGTNYPGEASNIPSLGTLLASVDVTDGGAAAILGGTLAIEKDQTADELRFITPAGSHTESLSAHSLQNANAMYSEQLEFTQKPEGAGTVNLTNTAHWRGFWTSEDSVRRRGASLTTVQPGVWFVTAWSYFSGESLAAKTHTQAVNEDQIQLAWTIGSSSVGDTRVGRAWNGGNNIALFTHELDATAALEHGVIWRCYSKSANPEKLYVDRTHDNGLTWRTMVAHTGGTLVGPNPEVVFTPNIGWYGARLTVVWSDGENILQRHSDDMGEHWEAVEPIFVNATGHTPRLPRFLIHPDHGLSYYFYVEQQTGKLYLRRSGDFGLTFTDSAPGVLLFTGAGLNWLDAWVDASGYVRVAFGIASGGEAVYKASNLGSTWDIDTSWFGFVAGGRQRSTYDRRMGLSYHVLYLPADSSIDAYASPDGGVTQTPDLSASLVVATAPLQTPAVAMQSNEGALVTFFNVTETLVSKHSNDFARSWD